jgi:hypothetical protein
MDTTGSTEVREVSGKGRALIAVKPLFQGQTVFQLKPYSAVLHKQALESCCSGSLVPFKSFWGDNKSMRCSACRCLRYDLLADGAVHCSDGAETLLIRAQVPFQNFARP